MDLEQFFYSLELERQFDYELVRPYINLDTPMSETVKTQFNTFVNSLTQQFTFLNLVSLHGSIEKTWRTKFAKGEFNSEIVPDNPKGNFNGIYYELDYFDIDSLQNIVCSSPVWNDDRLSETDLQNFKTSLKTILNENKKLFYFAKW